MLSTTDAIVLALQPHNDKAHLLHAYTRTGGRANYKVYGIGRKNTTGKYTPLAIVQLTIDEHSVRTAQLTYVPTTITTDPYKRAISLFISEVLYHVLRHPMSDEPMYEFITEAIRALDSTPADQVANFHLQFLADFAAKLGFAIPEDQISNHSTPTTRKARQEALRSLCSYFEEHVETWQTPRSLDILMEVFD